MLLLVCMFLAKYSKAGSGKTVITYVSFLLSTNFATQAHGKTGLSSLIICLTTLQTRTQKLYIYTVIIKIRPRRRLPVSLLV